MRSAVDSSVLFDFLIASPEHGPGSRGALEKALAEGALIACDVVWAEVRAHFSSEAPFAEAMSAFGVSFDPCDAETAAAAGGAWREYRGRGGSRERLIPDFLVAAHAATRCDRLITRDRGFARRYFPRLVIVDPSS